MIVSVLGVSLGTPSIASASDMGPVGPCLFLPLDLLGALAFTLLGLSARRGDASARSPLVLNLLGVLFGIPGLVVALSALEYLMSGSHALVAVLCVGAFGLMVSAFFYARGAMRTPRWDVDGD